MKTILYIIATILGGGWTAVRFEYQQTSGVTYVLLVMGIVSFLLAIAGTWKKLLFLVGILLLAGAVAVSMRDDLGGAMFFCLMILAIISFVSCSAIAKGKEIIPQMQE